MPSEYVKKLEVTADEVAKLTESDIQFLFGELGDMLANGQTICCGYELLRRYIKRKESFDRTKKFDLRAYDKKCRSFKKMEEHHRWMKELPTDFEEQEKFVTTSASAFSYEAIEDSDAIKNLLEQLKRKLPKEDVEMVLYKSLCSDDRSIKELQKACSNDSAVSEIIKELLGHPMCEYFYYNY